MIPLVARITGVADMFNLAIAAAEAVLSSPHAVPFHTIHARAGLALMAAHHGDVETAKNQYAELESQRGTILSFVRICADRVLGLLAQMMGSFEQAAAHFEDALAFCRKAGYRPELAWSLYDFATLLQAQGEREKAVALLNEALMISTELGMRPLTEKATTLKEKAEMQPARVPQYPDGLTQREVEVLRLIAAGKTDRQIADELFISIRTVGNHVSNILNKTAASNRTEAATYASRHDLT